MRVVVGKIDGVRDVKVSLNEGLATIQFAPGNRVAVEQIWKAIRSNGFTPRAADVRVGGLIVERGDTTLLKVPGSEDSYVLQDAVGSSPLVAALRRRGAGARVALTGEIPERAKESRASSQIVLRVRSLIAE